MRIPASPWIEHLRIRISLRLYAINTYANYYNNMYVPVLIVPFPLAFGVNYGYGAKSANRYSNIIIMGGNPSIDIIQALASKFKTKVEL
jgi:hypothetical protein